MTSDWTGRLTHIGLSDEAAARAAADFTACATALSQRAGTGPFPLAWWVPGRIEVLGKHTDYGGGRSLLCTVERGFHVVAAPRADRMVRLIDVSSRRSTLIRLEADTPERPGQWPNYPISVVRRLVRDAGVRGGADIAFSSSLPRASGLSSSSAFVTGCYLALAHLNGLDTSEEWLTQLGGTAGLAGYLGAVENGKAFGRFPSDSGVGTHGGSEDHTAILCCTAGALSQFRFLPVEHEATVPLSDDWTFVIAMSGVRASKSAGARPRYNALAGEVAQLVKQLGDIGHQEGSLLRLLEAGGGHSTRLSAALSRRLEQFRAESVEIIPAVTALLASGDVAGIGPLVARSQELAETVLGNQVAETTSLARSATDLGAIASSAFGAGFGGSVWALVRADHAAAFVDRWREGYLRTFPARAANDFFITRPGPPAAALQGS